MKDSNRPNSRRTVLGVCLLLAGVVFLVFGQTLRYQFVNYDDGGYFFSNPHVKAGLTSKSVIWAFQAGYASNWHPLTWWSLMLDAQLFGTGPAAPHLTNIVMHAVNAVLLFLLLRLMTGRLWPGAFVAAAFAIHPLRVESVAWVSERKDVLSGLFFMLTLLMYARYAQKMSRVESRESRVALTPALSRPTGEGGRRPGEGSSALDARRSTLDHAARTVLGLRLSALDYGLALLFFALGLMSKPMLVTVPFVLLLLDYWPLGRMQKAGDPILGLIWEKLPFLLLSAAACAMTLLAQREGIKSMVELPLGVRFGNALISCVTYLVQMIWPLNLAVFYPYDLDASIWKATGAGLLLLSITVLVILAARRSSYLAVGWLWYLGMLVPVIGLVQVGDQSHADRYTYLTQIGLCLAVVWWAGDLTGSWRYRREVLGAAALILLAAWMAVAWKQTSCWRDNETLWTHALACTPGNFTAYSNMGATLTDQGRFDEAIEYYRKVLELKPDSAGAENDWGKSLMGLGRNGEAAEHLQKAIEIDPNCAEAHNNLANLLAAEGRTAEASEHYQKAIKLRPERAEIYNNFGNLLAAQGRTAEAIQRYQKAIEVEPDYARAHYNLANLFAAQGRWDAAGAHFQKAVGIKPDYVEAHNDWGAMLLARGQTAEALQHFQKAIRNKPDYAEAINNFGSALAAQGRADAAIEQFQKALEIRPDYAKARYNLANIFAAQGRLDEAAEHYQRAAALMPDSTQAHYQLGLTLQRQGKFAPAIAQFQKVLELDRRHVGAQNDLAWLLATCPEASLRNGSRAVELARELEQLSGGNLPEILDTLAAAYAEAGRFGEAVESAGRALKIAASQHDKLLADGIQTRLRLYETNLPYHEKP